MALNIGFPSHDGTIADYTRARKDRLTSLEWDYLVASDPMRELGVPLAVWYSDIPTISSSSVTIIYERLLFYMPFDLIRWTVMIAKECIDERDDEFIQEVAKELVEDPCSTKAVYLVKRIFTHWLLDRFEGVQSNGYFKNTRDWLKARNLTSQVKQSDLNKYEREADAFWKKTRQAYQDQVQKELCEEIQEKEGKP